ncbi:MAG: DUF2225 domain-containing protein [Lachnospiraceae bacterium]|nr:DUF2225 domain-containing protein [Lachnospiraceae bacterium]
MGDMNLFSGLEALGFDSLDEVKIFEEKKEQGTEKEEKVEEFHEKDMLYLKTYQCPICDHENRVLAVRLGKLRTSGIDTDLRPIYEKMDPLKYDAVVCEKCGYAALSKFFSSIMSRQAKLVKEKITPSFRGINNDLEVYSYDEAILRHKLALLCTVVKGGKDSEKAYTCLKLAWMLRGKRDNISTDGSKARQIAIELQKEEHALLVNAYSGFDAAFSNEPFPMCGMDQVTLMCIMADICRRCGQYQTAKRWISNILVDKAAPERIKNKMRDLKELVSKEEKLAKQG